MSLRTIEVCNGVVSAVTDDEIKDAKAIIGKFGLGCEPASAASVAGLKNLVAKGIIGPDERVVCILTGHLLKDPNLTVDYHTKRGGLFSNPPIEVSNDLNEIIKLLK
jgi:threonine synthase